MILSIFGLLVLGGAVLWPVVTGRPWPTAGLMPAPLVLPADPTALHPPETPNWALALPPGWPPPEGAKGGRLLSAPRFDETPEALFARAVAGVAAAPGTEITQEDPQALHLVAVSRSRWVGFPDTLALWVVPLEGGGASLVLFSRSRVGCWDLGVNPARLRWLLDQTAINQDRFIADNLI